MGVRVCVAVAALLLCASASDANNVILLIGDDIGVDKIGTYAESPTAGPTPNLDALAARGVSFRNAWSYPVCSPARASMLTGLHPRHHRIGWYIASQDPSLATGLDPAQPTLPKLLSAAGVRTEAFGKWHLTGDGPTAAIHPNLAGFSHFAGFLWGGVDYYKWPKTVDGVTAYTTKYATTDTTDDVIAALSRTEPFFLWVGFLAVHTPYQAPPSPLYSGSLEGLTLPTNAVDFHRAMLEAMDREIGRILASVDLDNTTVIFIGDNGTNNDAVELPFRAGRAKFTLYEGGVNVPLIVAGQAVSPRARGRTSDALVQATDLFATILEIAGANGSAMDSTSLVPYLQDPARGSMRSVVYSEGFFPNGGPIDPLHFWRAARDDRYKIVRLAKAPDEFYDLVADPFEYSKLPLTNMTTEQEAAYRRLDATIRNAAAPTCSGDCNGDGYVSNADVTRLRKQFGNDCNVNPSLNCSCDGNGDGIVNDQELNGLLANFGSSCRYE